MVLSTNLTDSDLFQTFSNLGLYIIEADASEKQITINKICLKLVQNVYAKYANVHATQHQAFCDIFSPTIFADMNSSSHLVFNKTIALKMRLHLKSK